MAPLTMAALVLLVWQTSFGTAPAATGPAASRAAESEPSTRPADDRVNAKPVDPATVVSISVWPRGIPVWMLEVRPDGSARMQYGSGPFDSADLAPGTLDFKALVAEISAHQTTRPIPHVTRAGMQIKGTHTTECYPLDDDRYFRELLASLDAKWIKKGPRFDALRRDYPFYPGPEKRRSGD